MGAGPSAGPAPAAGPADPAVLADGPDTVERLAAEADAVTYSADRRGALAAVLAALFAAVALDAHGGGGLWPWAVGCAALAGGRWLLLRVSRTAARAAADSGDAAGLGARRRRTWLLLLTLSAVLWGLGPVRVMPATPAIEAMVTGIWLAAAGLSVPLLAASRPAVYLWTVPALTPLLIVLASAGHIAAWMMALVAAAFMFLLLHIGLEQNTLLLGALRARLRNERLVAQLREQVDVAARANQEKTRFLASAAHDLRQPLHALGLFCAALDQRLPDIPEKPLVRNMLRSIESLENSFNAMLDISRLDAGVVPCNPQAFAVRDLFRRLYQQFGGDAENKGLGLRFRAARRIVVSDPQLLERVLGNLVQNALRYTRDGGVLVAARRHPDGLAIEVWDTGPGIPDDQRELIFEEFYQIDNPGRDRGKGLGMGLAIVKRLCRLLEHRLEVHSRPGKGTLFRVVAPAGDRADVPAPPLEADTVPPRERPRVRVLMVEDEAAIREATRELLRPLQVEVVAFGSIAEAVAGAQQADEPFDLILSDWRLRGPETGIDAVRALRRICGEGTPAVLVTSDTSPDLVGLAAQNGLVMLHKPIQPRELIRLIGRFARPGDREAPAGAG